jgi:hypothetical protein
MSAVTISIGSWRSPLTVLEHHARLGDGQLVAFAAHVLQQDGQVQFAPAHDLEDAVFAGSFTRSATLELQFLLQPVPDLAAGDVLAFAAGQRAGVDAEVHGQRRLVDLEHRQRRRVGGSVSVTPMPMSAMPLIQHDVARAGLGGLHALQALEGQHLVDAALVAGAVGPFHHQHVHHGRSVPALMRPTPMRPTKVESPAPRSAAAAARPGRPGGPAHA